MLILSVTLQSGDVVYHTVTEIRFTSSRVMAMGMNGGLEYAHKDCKVVSAFLGDGWVEKYREGYWENR